MTQMMQTMAVFGIVVLAVFVLGILIASLLLLPVRYMKIKSM